MRLLVIALVGVVGCDVKPPATVDELGPPTRDPGVITEFTYDDPADVHAFCDSQGAGHRSPANPSSYVIHGCAIYGDGWCHIHYQNGVDSVRRHELAHCTHGSWHE